MVYRWRARGERRRRRRIPKWKSCTLHTIHNILRQNRIVWTNVECECCTDFPGNSICHRCFFGFIRFYLFCQSSLACSLLMRATFFFICSFGCCMNASKKFKLFATFVVTVAWENGFLMFIYARYRNIISFLCVCHSLSFLLFFWYCMRHVSMLIAFGEFQFCKCIVYVPYSHDTRKCVRPVQSQIECCMWGWLYCLLPHRDLAHLISLELVLK